MREGQGGRGISYPMRLRAWLVRRIVDSLVVSGPCPRALVSDPDPKRFLNKDDPMPPETAPALLDLRGRFVEGMARAATFVSVITTTGAAGRAGVTVSSMTSVSADGTEPSLLFCLHHRSQSTLTLLANRGFCANLLHENQQGAADLFSGRKNIDGAERFDQIDWAAGQNGQPILGGATASFECDLGTAVLWETHYIIVGKVTKVHLSDDPAALLYGQRAYRRAVSMPKT